LRKARGFLCSFLVGFGLCKKGKLQERQEQQPSEGFSKEHLASDAGDRVQGGTQTLHR
jgi:hypothetical protein